MDKIKKGQKVWQVQYGRRLADDSRITETEVVGVGSKYFRIACDDRNRYHIGTGKLDTSYSVSAMVYVDIQEYHNKVEHGNLSSIVRQILGGYGDIKLTLDQLRRIAAIIQEPKPSEICG